jgi:hypothetical protein
VGCSVDRGAGLADSNNDRKTSAFHERYFVSKLSGGPEISLKSKEIVAGVAGLEPDWAVFCRLRNASQ